MKSKRKMSSMLLTGLLVLVMIYAVFNFLSTKTHLDAKKAELEDIKKQCKEIEVSNEELRQLLESGNDSEYIKSVARSKLGYVYPNERVYVDVS